MEVEVELAERDVLLGVKIYLVLLPVLIAQRISLFSFSSNFIISKYETETADSSDQNCVSKNSKRSQDNFHRSMQQKDILRSMNTHKNISYSTHS